MGERLTRKRDTNGDAWHDPSSEPHRARQHSLDALRAASFNLSVSMQIMKSDEDVRMISAEAPVLFAKVGGPFLDPVCEFVVPVIGALSCKHRSV